MREGQNGIVDIESLDQSALLLSRITYGAEDTQEVKASDSVLVPQFLPCAYEDLWDSKRGCNRRGKPDYLLERFQHALKG
jgi:hypothetical protein